MSVRRSGRFSVAGWVGAVAVGVLLLAGCGSTSPTARSTPTSGTSAGTEVTTASSGLGVILVDAQGRTLYMTDADPEGAPGCYNTCSAEWPPLATTGDPTAAGEADSKELSTATRTDGITQVLYGGHPLYTFVKDTAAGQTNGQGLTQQGGMWWVMGVDGSPIKTAAESSGSAPASATSSGG